MTGLLATLAQRAPFASDAPAGIGLEWMTIAAIVVPAVLLIALVYVGNDRTV